MRAEFNDATAVDNIEFLGYSDLVTDPGPWKGSVHSFTAEQALPKDLDLKVMNEAFRNSAVELVEDTYSFNCGWPVDKTTQNNLRITFEHKGEKVVYRTRYEPPAVDQ